MRPHELEDKLDVIAEKLERVTILSEILKEKIEQIEDLEDRVQKVESSITYAKGVVIGLTAILAGTSGYIMDIFKRIF